MGRISLNCAAAFLLACSICSGLAAAPPGSSQPSSTKPHALFARLVDAANIPADATYTVPGTINHQENVQPVIRKIKESLPEWEEQVESGKTKEPVTLHEVFRFFPENLLTQALGQPERKSDWEIPFLLQVDGTRPKATVYWYGPTGLAVFQQAAWAILYEPAAADQPRVWKTYDAAYAGDRPTFRYQGGSALRAASAEIGTELAVHIKGGPLAVDGRPEIQMGAYAVTFLVPLDLKPTEANKKEAAEHLSKLKDRLSRENALRILDADGKIHDPAPDIESGSDHIRFTFWGAGFRPPITLLLPWGKFELTQKTTEQ